MKKRKQNSDTVEFYENLYKQYKYLILSVADDFISDRNAAEDILQDTMVKLLNIPTNLSELAPKALVSYIIKTTVTVTIDYERKRSEAAAHSAQYDSEAVESIKDPGVPSDEQLIQHEEKQRFYAIYNMLGKPEIELLNAKYIDGCSISDLASILNCKEGTVKSRLFRAKQHAKELFKDWGGNK